MKTDRELLELAAKAAGRTYVAGESWDEGAGWNPLTDDGDALRLAVKLEMTLDICHAGAQSVAFSAIPGSYAIEPWIDDPVAATRRAIVRAAAAIGEAML